MLHVEVGGRMEDRCRAEVGIRDACYVLLASLINLEAHGETSCARILIGIDGIIELIN
jgi:hypothetical protein